MNFTGDSGMVAMSSAVMSRYSFSTPWAAKYSSHFFCCCATWALTLSSAIVVSRWSCA